MRYSFSKSVPKYEMFPQATEHLKLHSYQLDQIYEIYLSFMDQKSFQKFLKPEKAKFKRSGNLS